MLRLALRGERKEQKKELQGVNDLQFLKNDSFSVRCSSKWIVLEGSSKDALSILLVCPTIESAVILELATCFKTSWLVLA
jgi:hypothetical protein